MKFFVKLLIFFQLIILVSFSFTGCKKKEVKQKKTIAYIGRHTDLAGSNAASNEFDLMHEHMLKKYIKELNKDIKNYELELVSYDCKRDGKEANKVYNTIAQDTSVIAVIDNTWGVHIGAAVDVIRDKNIPVIAINADHNNMDFGKQAIFTGNNDMLPEELSIYLKKALDVNEVVFVSEENYLLHHEYIRSFKGHGIGIAASFLIKANAEDKEKAFKELCAQITNSFSQDSSLKSKMIVINLHNEYGTKLLRFLDENHSNLRMIGHAYITQTVSSHVFGLKSGNELILINNPTDAMPKKLTMDMEEFSTINPELFKKLSSPMFPKRCMDATSIIGGFFKNPLNGTVSRENMANYFAFLRNGMLQTETDLLRFNEHNDLIPDLFYVKYKEGRLYSMREQLNSKKELIPNLVAGMEIIDLYNIDVNTNTFMADFYYWIKSDTSDKDAAKYILFPNMKEEGSATSLVLQKEEAGQNYQLYKASGLFHQEFNLKNYPFDKQEVIISMEIMAPTEKLKIAFDQSAFKQDTNLLDKFKVLAWNKNDFLLTVDNRISSTMRGDPDGREGEIKKYQIFSLRLFLTRAVAGPLLEIILPLILIGLVAIALLFVRNMAFDHVGDVSVGTFLAIITFSIAISSVTPASDYLTKSDILFWLTFTVVLACFLTIILVNMIMDAEHVKDVPVVKKIRWILLSVYLISCAFVVYFV